MVSCFLDEREGRLLHCIAAQSSACRRGYALCHYPSNNLFSLITCWGLIPLYLLKLTVGGWFYPLSMDMTHRHLNQSL